MRRDLFLSSFILFYTAIFPAYKTVSINKCYCLLIYAHHTILTYRVGQKTRLDFSITSYGQPIHSGALTVGICPQPVSSDLDGPLPVLFNRAPLDFVLESNVGSSTQIFHHP